MAAGATASGPVDLGAAIDELAARLLGRFGIVAISDEKESGHDLLVVFVNGDVAAAAREIPTEWRGVPIRVRPSEPIIRHS